MKYHISAFITVAVWSLTYISTKIVLETLTPLEISLYRFIIGYLFLLIIKPPRTFKVNLKEDLNIIISGFFGVFLYYVVENSATKLTQASHVAIIISTIPLITSIFAHYINKDERFKLSTIFTFIISFTGVTLVILDGESISSGLPIGNLLALLGAIIFALYNIFIRRIDSKIDPITRGRKINFYGLFFIIILYLITGEKSTITELLNFRYGFNILFLGIVASGLCVLMWGYSIKGLGAVTSSRYIYLAPVITGVASFFMLGEGFTLFKTVGMILVLTGMILPEIYKIRRLKRENVLT